MLHHHHHRQDAGRYAGVLSIHVDGQNEALDELLENRDLLAALAGDLTISEPGRQGPAGRAPGGAVPRAAGCGGDRLLPGGQGELLLGRQIPGFWLG
ncbi:MAG: hypothetical protein ACLRWQ_15860 [Flavonifractor plautii]